MKRTLKSGIVFSLLFSLLLSQSGCTFLLWADDKRDPAPTADLKLYYATNRNDILVVYKEESDRDYSIQSRAYWLNKNRMCVEKGRAPKFVPEKAIQNLSGIPVYNSVPEATGTNLYAIYGTNGCSFTLCSGGLALSSYPLPIYNNNTCGMVEKIALTPLALSVDISIAALYLWLLAHSND